MLRLLRTLVLLIGLSHGVLAAVITAPEMKAADASVTPVQQILTTILIAGFYFLIAGLALKDFRAATTLALAFTFLLTPPLALLVVFSGWSEHSWALGRWLLVGIAGNIVLFVISAFVVFLMPRQQTQS